MNQLITIIIALMTIHSLSAQNQTYQYQSIESGKTLIPLSSDTEEIKLKKTSIGGFPEIYCQNDYYKFTKGKKDRFLVKNDTDTVAQLKFHSNMEVLTEYGSYTRKEIDKKNWYYIDEAGEKIDFGWYKEDGKKYIYLKGIPVEEPNLRFATLSYVAQEISRKNTTWIIIGLGAGAVILRSIMVNSNY